MQLSKNSRKATTGEGGVGQSQRAQCTDTSAGLHYTSTLGRAITKTTNTGRGGQASHSGQGLFNSWCFWSLAQPDSTAPVDSPDGTSLTCYTPYSLLANSKQMHTSVRTHQFLFCLVNRDNSLSILTGTPSRPPSTFVLACPLCPTPTPRPEQDPAETLP